MVQDKIKDKWSYLDLKDLNCNSPATSKLHHTSWTICFLTFNLKAEQNHHHHQQQQHPQVLMP